MTHYTQPLTTFRAQQARRADVVGNPGFAAVNADTVVRAAARAVSIALGLAIAVVLIVAMELTLGYNVDHQPGTPTPSPAPGYDL